MIYTWITADPTGPASGIPTACVVTVKDESGSTLWSSTDTIFTTFANLGTPSLTDYVVRSVGNLGGGNIYVADGGGSLSINRSWIFAAGPTSTIGQLMCSVCDPAVVNPQPPPYDVGTVSTTAVKGGYVASW